MKRLIFFLLLFSISAGATTYTASSCSQSAVQTAISDETATPADGDIIATPSG
jgi:hypothetical protein